ncbi:hypothetical protein N7493_004256 [Penicillium malachiteum]|uniref:Uncharacterized protein n=1 Tax=Penicillium malachiteum TaxID=1324776 RepID=A0AAD6HR73_9EURO|nr:hypothetical protein N7493_004256 [Penicillium malachiteum]
MAATGTIAEAARLCKKRFTQFLKVPSLQYDRWAESCVAEMERWISDTGACDQGRASLDFKLASQPETRDLVVNSLRQLSATIDECVIQIKIYEDSLAEPDQEDSVDSYEGQDQSSLSWSDDSSSGDQSEEAGKKEPSGNTWPDIAYEIDKMQSRFERLAVDIRQSWRCSWWQKADEQFDATEHQELEDHLAGILLAQLESEPQERDLSKLNEVQLRLIRCNLMRRNRFLYARQNMEASFTGHSINRQKEQAECKPEEVTNNTMVTGSLPSESANRLSAILGPFRSTTMPSAMIDLGYPRPPRCHKDTHNFSVHIAAKLFPQGWPTG